MALNTTKNFIPVSRYTVQLNEQNYRYIQMTRTYRHLQHTVHAYNTQLSLSLPPHEYLSLSLSPQVFTQLQ